jgi:hypothetical protein
MAVNDDGQQRSRTTARLEDAVAHVADAEARMPAHLWRLTGALECLDLAAVRRQLRALDLLAAESGSAANAIGRVAAADPSLGRLLSDTVTTGAICRYDPDPDRPVRWVLSAG